MTDSSEKGAKTNEIATELSNELGDGFVFSSSFIFPDCSYPADIVVCYKDSTLLAIGSYTEDGYHERDLCELKNKLLKLRLQIGFLFDENSCYQLITRDDNQSVSVDFHYQLSDIASAIKDELTKREKEPDKTAVKERIIQILDSIPTMERKKSCKKLLMSLCNNLEYELGEIFLSEKDENKFMLTLLGKTRCEFLWRYTSLSSLFETLNNKTQAMCCPVSMNDASEGTYADSKMIGVPYDIKNEKDYRAENEIFMLSCCDCREEDALSMWRLYGNDSKGACLKYDVHLDRIENDAAMYFAKVSYAEKDGTHPELGFLSKLQNIDFENNWHFTLRKWHIWRYFFKTHEYSIEKEIRLIYDNSHKTSPKLGKLPKIEWYLDNSYQIFNRRAVFETKDFPLTISEIVLGANSPNAETNIRQLKFMRIEEELFNHDINYSVRKSQIDNYRK